ncbi:hypothetical protein TIFTF001_015099 [Ficus carica]|uniref:Uncharacterized protein n=1 Tax=Ficus carica TaxID=3494 RepID=A0AA88DIK6_FICCA|nr:hypothetical protein TIFTF001_015099 [Ficus carica]
MTGDTTASSYWLNWRVLLCGIWVLLSLTLAVLLILKFEGFRNSKRHGTNGREPEEEASSPGVLYDDETWKPCLKNIHPAWLLAFRLVAFFVLLVLLIITASVDGGAIFYYYTQWTFALVTIYFGLGTLLSIRGCYRHHKKASGDKVDSVEVDSEQGTHMTPALVLSKSCTSNRDKNLGPNAGQNARQPAGLLSYLFQIIFQMNAGAVVLTDCVFWFIIVPFLTIKDYNLNFLIINMHTINAVFLLGETALNCLRFPWFRIGYFFLWTVFYVVFQWIVHASVKLWWPYPFLDLSSSYAPLWYFSVGLMHIPCYGIFALIIKLKHHIYSTKYPDSYRCEK